MRDYSGGRGIPDGPVDGGTPARSSRSPLSGRGRSSRSSLRGAVSYEERSGLNDETDRFFRAHAAFGLATVRAKLHRIPIEAGTGAESGYPPLVDYVTRLAEVILTDSFSVE